MPNSSPFLSNLVLNVTIGEEAANLTPQLIDNDVTFIDADNNFDGGTLVLSGLLADDIGGVRNQGTGAGQIGFADGAITYGGTLIGTASGGTGTALSVTFNSNANSASIEALIENLTYSTLSDSPHATRTLDLAIIDAAGARAVAPIGLTERTGAENPFSGIDIVGSDAKPTLGDLDGDGDLDLIIGEQDGTLNYYENTGTRVAPAYTERTGGANPLNGLDFGSVATPALVDLDGDGDLDVVVGNEDGVLHFYENTGTTLAPAFTGRSGAANPFNGIDIGSSSAPHFADVDGDGDLDLVTGEHRGDLSFFENTGTNLAPPLPSVQAQQTRSIAFTQIPAAIQVLSIWMATAISTLSPATSSTTSAFTTRTPEQRLRLSMRCAAVLQIRSRASVGRIQTRHILPMSTAMAIST